MQRATVRNICLALLCALPMASCSTTHLLRWARDEPSAFAEPTNEFSRGFWKGFVTFVGFPVALGWDIVTFPFQIISASYPYGDGVMQPDDDIDV